MAKESSLIVDPDDHFDDEIETQGSSPKRDRKLIDSEHFNNFLISGKYNHVPFFPELMRESLVSRVMERRGYLAQREQQGGNYTLTVILFSVVFTLALLSLLIIGSQFATMPSLYDDPIIQFTYDQHQQVPNSETSSGNTNYAQNLMAVVMEEVSRSIGS
eukprot:CAMPEP_0115005506 /NCGR_PEP_ID=MMETSP0216-20121206/19914_1 /TAXON_ID=223996 /ORGANISM="Protocruzia adherens, Strain Boccale" /LENGTH=159 /DNA_ID=CAMNT_0002371849 /DNA_START=28 /DNA_END=507 /DNA_ORIENTATION=+